MKDEYDFSKGKRGPVIPPDPNQTKITVAIDNEILDFLADEADRRGGASARGLINEALREFVEAHRLDRSPREEAG